MNIMTFSVRTYVACCACMLILTGFAPWGIAAEPGTITAVRLSPDMKSLSIQHDGRVGNCSSFVMQNPYRLVIDINEAQPARIPSKIPVPGASVSEIRLGYANSRTRVVVDFGNNPVPAFNLVKGVREIRVNLGRGVALQGANSATPGKREQVKPAAPKPATPKLAAPPPSATKKNTSPLTVKSARADKNRVLLELAENHNPGKTYVLAVEMDTQDLNVRGATLRDDKGTVKRFQLSAAKDGLPGVRVETVSPWDTMGKQSPESSPLPGKPRFKWGLKADSEAGHGLSGPTKKGVLHMEGFVLKPRAEQGS